MVDHQVVGMFLWQGSGRLQERYVVTRANACPYQVVGMILTSLVCYPVRLPGPHQVNCTYLRTYLLGSKPLQEKYVVACTNACPQSRKKEKVKSSS